MLALSSRAALLPALGLCSCAVASSRAAEAPAPGLESAVPNWIEDDSPVAVPTVFEAAVQSGRTALARGEYAAARESLTAALAFEESAAMVLELRLAEIDALVGQRQFQTAKDLLAQLRNGSITDPGIDSREMAIREHEHAYGFTSCEAAIDSEPRALARHEDFLSAWNDVRDGFPRKADLPIPTDEDDAHGLLCPSCIFEEASFSTFELGEEQMIWNVVVEHIDSGVSVLPELIAGTMSGSCADNVQVITQRKGDLVWVRAFADAREDFDPNDWALGDEAELGAPAPTPAPSPSYYAYATGSSGYQGSGYQGTGYHYHYGCGGYDYYYNESCMITQSIERDVFIDLARGEVVLDIVRTGKPTSALGFVRLEQDAVRVDACGVTQTLPLSFTA